MDGLIRLMCECGHCREAIDIQEYDLLSANVDYQDAFSDYFIILQKHVHKIPNKLEIIDRTNSLFLVNIEID